MANTKSIEGIRFSADHTTGTISFGAWVQSAKTETRVERSLTLTEAMEIAEEIVASIRRVHTVRERNRSNIQNLEGTRD